MSNLYFQITISYACGCTRIRFVSEGTSELIDPQLTEEVASPLRCPDCDGSAKRRKQYEAEIAERKKLYELWEEGVA